MYGKGNNVIKKPFKSPRHHVKSSVPYYGMAVPNNGTHVPNYGMHVPNNGTELPTTCTHSFDHKYVYFRYETLIFRHLTIHSSPIPKNYDFVTLFNFCELKNY